MTLPLSLKWISDFDWRTLAGYYQVWYESLIVLVAAAIPAALFVTNVFLFRRPGREWNRRVLPPVSVLIPARNEEAVIGAAIESVLASRGVDIELIVLDDGSTDATAEIVRGYAEQDPRLRLRTAPPLPEGWNGKQYACWTLASLANHDVFCYLDADVRLGSEAIYRMVSELNWVDSARPDEPELALVSGFPAQETGTFLEKLLLPLIHFVLLGFLPLAGERWSRRSGFAAGCGQFMMVRREAYFVTGGHSAIPLTMHDGLLLPQLFRRYRFRTAVFDLSKDAVCRMYRGAGAVWSGLAKNATEGMASPARLPVFTVLLLVGEVLPLPLAVLAFTHYFIPPLRLLVAALALGYAIRLYSAWRYRQSWLGAALHPFGVLVLLVLQWYAFFRKLLRIRATWKDRAYKVG
jgi:glycosyltransferase involved in cell wall biosynthesis